MNTQVTGDTGGGQPHSNLQPSLAMSYIIRTTGSHIGEVVPFAGNYAPGGWALCQGQALTASSNPGLFVALGNAYGGNGTTTFALPNLIDRIPAAYNNMQPSLTLHSIICLSGVFPQHNSTDTGDDVPFLGEVSLFAGNFAAAGWAFADGQTLPTAQYSALFSILGTTYGGNGLSTFVLPDLQGRTVLGAGGLYPLGDYVGAESNTLSVNQIPAHDHTLTPVPEPATLALLAPAVLLMLSRRKH